MAAVTRILSALALALVALAVSLAGVVWMAAALIAGSPRGWRLALAFDQLGNAMTGGDEDEVISSRAWRNRHRQPWTTIRQAIDAVAARLGDPDHCRRSAYGEAAKLDGRRRQFWGLER